MGEMFYQASNCKSQNCHTESTIRVKMKMCRSSQLCSLLTLEWSLYFEHMLRSHCFDVNHSTPLYIQASGLKEIWMNEKLHGLYMI